MDIIFPALVYYATTFAVGVGIYFLIRRPILSAIITVSVIIPALMGITEFLPWSLRHYVQDMIYEPLVRDIFDPYEETIFSALFHLAVPIWLLKRIQDKIPNQKEKET